jgi:mannose-6-phosphate isomerase
MHSLTSPTRAYAWGSATAIPAFLGREPTGEAVAELWLGTHHLAPSEVMTSEGPVPLAEVAGELPFMLKMLAPDQPLSIQVHPSSTLAELGFAAEEAAGVPLDDPTRDFKDPNHKPEMVYALTAFDMLVGLRPMDEIRDLLSAVDVAVARRLMEHVHDGPLAVLRHVLTRPPTRDEVNEFVETCEELAELDIGRAYETVSEVARFHPGDPGIVVALLLNRLALEPGQAAFIGPGLLHAHLSGLCLEVMVSSDNVMRAGLTPKRVNPQGLLKCIDPTPAPSPEVLPRPEGESLRIFEPPGGLFALAVVDSGDGPIELPGEGRRILLCLDGPVVLGRLRRNSHD